MLIKKREVPMVHMPDEFDRAREARTGLPDSVCTKESIVTTIHPILGTSQTWIIQTYRQKEVGDHVFLQALSAATTIRLALPPEVANLIARQRDALTSKVRVKIGKESAAARKARGEKPAFMKGKKKGA